MKKLMAIILSMAMVLSITACNSDGGIYVGNNNTSTTPRENNQEDEINHQDHNNNQEDEINYQDHNNNQEDEINYQDHNNSQEDEINQDSNTDDDVISFSWVKIGDTIQLGKLSSGHINNIEWRVLDIQDEKALVLSEDVLLFRAYQPITTGVAFPKWEDSDMREFLNGVFYNERFTANERKRIVEQKIENKNNQWYDTESGGDTVDRLFLLSLEEVVKYFGDSGQLDNQPLVNNMYVTKIDDVYNDLRIAYRGGNPERWLLRSPGIVASAVASVRHNGWIEMGSSSVGWAAGVRPAMWLDIS
jgi:predicted small lipoprotein YifL